MRLLHPDARIDLHAHTTASDGLLSPGDLLAHARHVGLDVLAITDHDTAAGVRAALREEARTAEVREEVQEGAAAPGSRRPLEVVSGIEVSSQLGRTEVHILGYFIDPEDPGILSYEAERRGLRRSRIERMVSRLQAAGMAIDMAGVDEQIGGDGAPGRPHVARVLVARGYAKDFRDCFRRLFSEGGPGYVPYEKIAPEAAVRLIEGAGGLPVIAHPGLDRVEDHIPALKAAGLRGLEVWHGSHEAETTARLERVAAAEGLLPTGGSDFHGTGQSEGADLGRVLCPREAFVRLCEAATRTT